MAGSRGLVRTAKGEQLSLRDVILRWCDPALVSAVQAAEAPFTRDQVEAACPCSLGGAAPGAADPRDLGPEAIARIRLCFTLPWNSLDADLRSRVMISRIQLCGVPVQAGAGAPAEPIPPSYVEQNEFNYFDNAVIWFRGGWQKVAAILSTEARPLDDSADEALPLRQAMLTWCDDALVDRYETAVMADQLAKEIRSGRLHRDRERRYAGISIYNIDRVERPWRDRLRPATAELHADFRARLASGAIELTGLQSQPVPAIERLPLAPIWAERMEFDWQRQSVKVAGTLFEDVLGARTAAKLAAPVAIFAPKKQRGRRRFPLAKMVAIARARRAVRATNMKLEADMLLREFCMRHPSEQAPTVRTIQDHVAKIYAAIDDPSVPL